MADIGVRARPPNTFLFSLLLLLPLLGRGEENWSQLKLGMTAEQTFTALGSPMFRTSGTGFELWTYDNGSEVLLYGSLIGWTAPRSAHVAVRCSDIWQANHSEAELPTFLTLLPPPTSKPGARRREATRAVGGSDNDVWLPFYVTRRR